MSMLSTGLSDAEKGGAGKTTGLSSIELERIISLQEAARLRSTSLDSVKRNLRKHIIVLGPRRLGIRLKHALALCEVA